ncbi:hypothetical protein PVA17_19995 [Lysinibacillus sp. CNPSo 3705]|uniref:hypothetical protein n=1 Tax=Lysinibacillus sp. CNPSo 3705 TaxID=3028148 RepID=UPI0023631E61|nr:hypothetical protein [Lysinibacillus sp. CNPSo 3705]MDD1505026.1 hypothetical protein [Lysinibacillus sp. CNPSo 3705]
MRESEASAADVFLRESEASAANVFCAKAKRQRQMFSARKQSVSAKASYNQALEDYEKLDVDLQQQANVSYRQTKRGSVDSIVLSNDMKNHRIIWEENIGVINAEQKNPAGSYFKELLCH